MAAVLEATTSYGSLLVEDGWVFSEYAHSMASFRHRAGSRCEEVWYGGGPVELNSEGETQGDALFFVMFYRDVICEAAQ
jgi:hypothetical protein